MWKWTYVTVTVTVRYLVIITYFFSSSFRVWKCSVTWAVIWGCGWDCPSFLCSISSKQSASCCTTRSDSWLANDERTWTPPWNPSEEDSTRGSFTDRLNVFFGVQTQDAFLKLLKRLSSLLKHYFFILSLALSVTELRKNMETPRSQKPACKLKPLSL